MTKAKLSCMIFGATVVAGAASLAVAERPASTLLQVGELIHGGAGCPQGTLRHAWSPDGQRLAIGFDGYVARAEPGASFDRASCAIAIPVRVPRGMRVSLSRLRVYGYADIPQDSRGSFDAEYFLAGAVGPMLEQELREGFVDDFVLTSYTPAWSACGEDGIIRINSSALARQLSAQPTPAVVEIQFMTIQIGMERCRF